MKLTSALALSCSALMVLAAPAAQAVKTDPGAPAPQAVVTSKAPTLAQYLRLTSGEKLVKVSSTEVNGTIHTRYDRTFNGLKVIGGDLVVHADAKSGRIKETTKAGSGKAAVKSTTPKLGKDKAFAAVKSLKANKTSGGTLVIFAREGEPKLAYDVISEGVKADQTPFKTHSYVDATTGEVLGIDEEIKTGSGNGVHVGQVTFENNSTASGYVLRDSRGHYACDMRQATSGTCYDITDADNYFGNGTNSDRASAGVDAFFGAQKTYDYFKATFNRNGIWNDGRGAGVRVHYGNNYENATWNGSVMTFGDGQNNANPLTQLDVTAHEMGHGVTESMVDLVYSGESGGLNESFSDIWGNSVEFYANMTTDPGDYLMGEKLSFGPIRRMDKPSWDGQSKDCYYSGIGSIDVHYSSGPNNHAFYLLSEGTGSKVIGGANHSSTTCNGTTMTGIGQAKAGKIMYGAYQYLTTTSGYVKMRDAAIQSAIDLYGSNSAECTATEKAYAGISVPAGTKKCGTIIDQPTDGVLVNGVAQTVSGATGSDAYWSFVVPANSTNLVVSIAGGTGDADLYLKAGAKPTDSVYDCRPYLNGNNESCTVAAPAATTYYVRLKGYSAFSGVTLKATWQGQSTGGQQLLLNSGFESGATSWTGTAGAITTAGTIAARTGSYKVLLNGAGTTNTDYVQQTVTIPATAATAKLSFYVRITSAETTTSTAYDTLKTQIISNGVTTTLGTLSNLSKNTGYALVTYDLAAFKGKSVTVKFLGYEDSSYQTTFVIDDTALNIS